MPVGLRFLKRHLYNPISEKKYLGIGTYVLRNFEKKLMGTYCIFAKNFVSLPSKVQTHAKGLYRKAKSAEITGF
jgi:hypothetical protein